MSEVPPRTDRQPHKYTSCQKGIPCDFARYRPVRNEDNHFAKPSYEQYHEKMIQRYLVPSLHDYREVRDKSSHERNDNHEQPDAETFEPVFHFFTPSLVESISIVYKLIPPTKKNIQRPSVSLFRAHQHEYTLVDRGERGGIATFPQRDVPAKGTASIL